MEVGFKDAVPREMLFLSRGLQFGGTVAPWTRKACHTVTGLSYFWREFMDWRAARLPPELARNECKGKLPALSASCAKSAALWSGLTFQQCYARAVLRQKVIARWWSAV